MTESHHNENPQSSSPDPLHALNSIHVPDGMQSRVTKHLQQIHQERPARSIKRYAWELWAGAAIGVAAVITLCSFLAPHSNRTTPTSLAANAAHNVIPVTAPQSTLPAHKPARLHATHSPAQLASIPQSPPPLPLTQQERLLIALASKPSLAAGSAISQPVPDHGLGANSIFDLDHEQLAPLQAEPLESTPLPPAPSDSTPSGESK